MSHQRRGGCGCRPRTPTAVGRTADLQPRPFAADPQRARRPPPRDGGLQASAGRHRRRHRGAVGRGPQPRPPAAREVDEQRGSPQHGLGLGHDPGSVCAPQLVAASWRKPPAAPAAGRAAGRCDEPGRPPPRSPVNHRSSQVPARSSASWSSPSGRWALLRKATRRWPPHCLPGDTAHVGNGACGGLALRGARPTAACAAVHVPAAVWPSVPPHRHALRRPRRAAGVSQPRRRDRTRRSRRPAR